MKQFLYILFCVILVSCIREPVRINTTTSIEGDYTDTTSYTHPSGSPIAYPDTIVKKTVYKINDSTFWMVALKCNDSLNFCGNLGPALKLGFTIKSNNSIQYFPLGGAVTIYPPILAIGSYYDPATRYIYLAICNDLLCDRKEVHRMKRL